MAKSSCELKFIDRGVLMQVSALAKLRSRITATIFRGKKGDVRVSLAHIEHCSPYVDDGEPWHHLKSKGFRQKLGLLKSPVNHRWDDEDREAVQYLCKEWGWTWSNQEV